MGRSAPHSSVVTTITLNMPKPTATGAEFSWSIEPDDSFYRQKSFELEYPMTIDAGKIPDAVWARVMLVSLHTHWAMLRPCRVVLPFRLTDRELEFWRRLTDAAVWSLETRRENAEQDFPQRTQRAIDFVCTGEPIPTLSPPDPGDCVAASFSGGRDSMTQLGLLQELGEKPFLVTTTSSRPGSQEMISERRQTVMQQIQRRRDVELVEVQTGYRNCFNTLHDRAVSYGVSVNEASDTFLYFATAWAAAYARGANAVYLASEAEVQESIRREGMVVQYTHFMYSAVSQRALSELIKPSSISYSGLTYPLFQLQIHHLLNTRFTDIRDLQYSCWEQQPGEAACSRCSTCLQSAVNLMRDDVSPSEIGIDLNELLIAKRDWRPRPFVDETGTAELVSVRRYIEGHSTRFLREQNAETLERFAGPGGLSKEARIAANRICAAAAQAPDPGPQPGYRAGYLELVNPALRKGLESIIKEHFEPEPPENYAELLRNTRMLSEWITSPLSAAPPDESGRRSDDDRPARAVPPGLIAPTTAQLAEIAELIPGPEPVVDHEGPQRYLPVADTDLSGNELAYVTEAIETNWVSSAGPYVGRLEARFAEYCGTRHAITTASGATAIEVMLRAAGIGPGDEVILPSFTMVATANAVHHTGAKPVFVDNDLATWNMDLAQVRLAIGPKTRAIMAMHTYGHPVDMDLLREIADANSLVLFEDAAEAHGATVRGRRVGALSDAAAFSFYGNKIMTTGEGGIITTDDDEIAEVARSLRSHAFSPERHFWHGRRAFNFRMSNLQAALGIAQLERLDEFLEQRRALAQLYRDQLRPIPGVSLPPQEQGLQSANWMFGLSLDDDFPISRDELRGVLAADGIETRTFFVPLHIQPAYIDEHEGRRLPVAELMGARGLYLPSALWLEEQDVARIAERIAQAAGVAARVTSRPKPE